LNSTPSAPKSLKPGVEDAPHSTPEDDWEDLAASIQPETLSDKSKPLSALSTQPPSATSKLPTSAPANATPPVSKPLSQNVEDTARSIPKQALADLAASLQPKSIEDAIGKPKSSPVSVPQPSVMNAKNAEPAVMNSAPTAAKLPAQNPEDTARSISKHDWADLAASLQTKSTETVVVKPKPAPASPGNSSAGPSANSQPGDGSRAQSHAAPSGNLQTEPANSATPGSPDPALVEAVVQRVLEKMRPQVVDIITKEFLRPVVQALVHREVTKR
jgi:hypothetical protein